MPHNLPEDIRQYDNDPRSPLCESEEEEDVQASTEALESEDDS